MLKNQQKLHDLGYYYGDIDGINGGMTKDAVRQFQMDHHLYVDGDIGPQTQKELDNQQRVAGGRDNFSYPYKGNANEARVWMSSGTIKKCLAAGGAQAAIALLSTIFGNFSGPVTAAIGLIVGFGVSVIADKVGNNQGAVFTVGVGQASTLGVSSMFGYNPVWDIHRQ